MHAARPCAAPHEGRLCGQRMLAATPAPITQGQGPRPASAPCASATVSGRTSSARLASSLSTTWRAASQCLLACAAASQGRSGPRRRQRCQETGKDADCLAVITISGTARLFRRHTRAARVLAADSPWLSGLCVHRGPLRARPACSVTAVMQTVRAAARDGLPSYSSRASHIAPARAWLPVLQARPMMVRTRMQPRTPCAVHKCMRGGGIQGLSWGPGLGSGCEDSPARCGAAPAGRSAPRRPAAPATR